VTDSPLQAVLFDMDGLLIDSEPLWFEAERAVMARLGGEWGPADQEALLGGSLSRTVSHLLAKAPPGPGVPSRDEIARWLLDGMTGLMTARGVPLRPGAAGLLAQTAAEGVPYALVTASQRGIMQTALAVTGMSFPVTVCGEDVAVGKPAPDPYLRAAALLGADPGGCVVLEDSPAGIAAGQAAGCHVIAVPSMPLPGPWPPGVVVAGSLAELSLSRLREVAAAGARPAR
jgi:HAD superfamily hydrolase (TIGR01509 family)